MSLNFDLLKKYGLRAEIYGVELDDNVARARCQRAFLPRSHL